MFYSLVGSAPAEMILSAPERKSIRKRSMKPTLSAARTFGIMLASTNPRA